MKYACFLTLFSNYYESRVHILQMEGKELISVFIVYKMFIKKSYEEIATLPDIRYTDDYACNSPKGGG